MRMAEPLAPVLPGETLAGKYRIERVLGRGGMGIVLAARHIQLDERVAIKFLLGEHSDDSAERFLREGRAAAKVKGEHVCRVFDFGRLETGEPYLVMDHLEGVDLARKLANDGPQTASTVVGWVIQACDALADAHAMGIVHRDLKPANLFLSMRPDGSSCAKVLDFGISKLARAETMTAPAITMGSPVYMSPEQMESARDVDARSDVWSLGVVMYELMAGRPPFVGESMVQLTVLVREQREEPLEIVVPGLDVGLARVVARCLEKNPEARYASVADLASALAPHAPPEVSALVERLVRRSTSEPALPLASTSPDPSRATPTPASSATETSQPIHLDRARGTFEPVQSSVGVATRAPAVAPTARRWPIAGALAILLVVSATLLASTMRATPPAFPTPAAATAVPTETAPIVALPVLPVASEPVTLPPVASPASAPKPPPRPATVPSRNTAPEPTPLVSATPSAVVSAPAVGASTPAAKSASHRPRELDRDDP